MAESAITLPVVVLLTFAMVNLAMALVCSGSRA
ncbi:hypothetical protein [Pelolinea submarina]|nr:hypothetical protein [Pelolinea submarina]